MLALDTDEKQELISYVKAVHSSSLDNPEAYLLRGCAGVGKSETPYALARDVDGIVVEVNASLSRNVDNFKSRLDDEIVNRPMNINGDGEDKVIILIDEIDGLLVGKGVDKGGLCKYIKDIIEIKTVPIFITCNNKRRYEVVNTFKKYNMWNYINEIEYNKISSTKMKQFFKNVNDKENLGMSIQEIMRLSRDVNGDMRKAYMILSMPEGSEMITGGKYNVDIFDVLDSLFGTDTVVGACNKIRLSDDSLDKIYDWVFKNVRKFTNDIETVDKIYTDLSKLDSHVRRPNMYGGKKAVRRRLVMAIKDNIGIGRDKFRFYEKPDNYDIRGKQRRSKNYLEDMKEIFDGLKSMNNIRKSSRFMRNLFQNDKQFRIVVSKRIYDYTNSKYPDDNKAKNEFLKLISFFMYDSFEVSGKAEEMWDMMESGDGVDIAKSFENMDSEGSTKFENEDDEHIKLDSIESRVDNSTFEL